MNEYLLIQSLGVAGGLRRDGHVIMTSSSVIKSNDESGFPDISDQDELVDLLHEKHEENLKVFMEEGDEYVRLTRAEYHKWCEENKEEWEDDEDEDMDFDDEDC